jgi:serine/threonine protein kinase
MGYKYYGVGLDTWSLGCILAEMFTGKPLFGSNSEIDCLFKIFEHLGTPDRTIWPTLHEVPFFSAKFPKFKPKGFAFLKEINPQFDETAHDLLVQMLKLNPNQRMNLKQVLDHPFFK